MINVAVYDSGIIAQELAAKIKCRLVHDLNAVEFVLHFVDDVLQLHWQKFPKTIFRPDFSQGMIANLCKANAAIPLVVKALNLKKYVNAKVLDLTAGFGEDGLSFALYGAEVLLLERNAVVAALLQSALVAAKHKHIWAEDLAIECIHADAVDYLVKLPIDQYPDIIYYDPMFAVLKNTAAVKKEMQLLRALVGHSTDNVELEQVLCLARQKCKQRVVLKRHRLAQKVLQPNHSYCGKSTRFDVYNAQ
jgi:16S rRNA (guanine1516-N2)-methyltransferase